jgi:hypothetical protein
MVMRSAGRFGTLVAVGLAVGLAACGGRSAAARTGVVETDEDAPDDAGTATTPPAPTGTPGDAAPVTSATPSATPTSPMPAGTIPSGPPPTPSGTPAPTGSGTPAPTGSGTPAPTGNAGAPGEPVQPEPPLDVEPSALEERWRVEVTGASGYFLPFDYEGATIFGFTADGARVALAGQSSVAEFDAETGAELVPARQIPRALTRDPSASLELRNEEGTLELRDLALDAARWAVPGPVGLELAAFSADGLHAVTLACDAGIAAVQRFSLEDGTSGAALEVGSCEARLYATHLARSLVALPAGGRVLVGGVSSFDGDERGGVFEVDFDSSQSSLRRIFPESDHHVVELRALPADAGLAVIGSDDQLHVYDDAAFLTPRFSVAAPLPYFAYYVPPLVAPLGVSSDARYLATIHEDALSIALRRTSDGVVLASALGPATEQPHDPTVPILAAFDARGDRLAVLWLRWLALYDVR